MIMPPRTDNCSQSASCLSGSQISPVLLSVSSLYLALNLLSRLPVLSLAPPPPVLSLALKLRLLYCLSVLYLAVNFYHLLRPPIIYLAKTLLVGPFTSRLEHLKTNPIKRYI